MDKLLTLNGSNILYTDVRDRLKTTDNSVNKVDNEKVGYAEVTDDGYLVLKAHEKDTEYIAKLTGFGGGGGGGGGSVSSKVSLTNLSGVLPTSISDKAPYVVKLEWSSIDPDTEVPTGPGIITIKVNNITRKTANIPQGYWSEDLSPYLYTGANDIKITISDIYDNFKRISFSVSVLTFELVSSFNEGEAFKDAINFNYTAKGEGDKVMHFILDGTEIGTKTISTTNREDTFLIPKQSIGSHFLETYFLVSIGTDIIKSNELSYDIMCYEDGVDQTIISCNYRDISIQQYSTLNLSYYAFNPLYTEVNIDYYIDDVKVSSLSNVGREKQVWSRRLDTVGNHVFSIKSGEASKNINVTVTKVDVDIKAETQNLSLHLSSENRSNLEEPEKRSTWEWVRDPEDPSKTIKAQFSNFNWNTDGWVQDSQGIPVMRVKDDARIVIPYQPFSTEYRDIKNTGKTIEFEFSTSGVFDYDTEIISCWSGGRGFKVTAQQALFSSSVSSSSAQFKENEHVRIGFVICPTTNNRLIYCYVNGIISGLVQYPVTAEFFQNPPVNISIGSSDAIVDIYRIRIYDKDLSRFQVVNNWIADMQNGEQLLSEYKRNTIYDSNDEISLELVKTHLPTLPYMVVDTEHATDKSGNLVGHLPEYKGQKLLVGGYYVDPNNPDNSFSWKNGEFDVQGTSSQAYPIKNFKIKIKKSDNYGTEKQKATDCSGFIMTQESEKQGKEVIKKKYSMRGQDESGKDLSVPTNTFVFKADYASSEGANNVELVRFYNDTCATYVYKTPPQEEDNRLRQGIDGFPIIWFQQIDGKIKFIGKYNFNNHKGTDEVYGFDYHGETFEETDVSDYERTVIGEPDESWEIADNNSDLALWKRYAGDAQKEILIDNVTGKTVTYDEYISGDNLVITKLRSLSPMYDGTHDTTHIEDVPKYQNWVAIWKTKYKDMEDWINQLAILKIHDAGESLEDDIKEQRNFCINLMKIDIREIFNLRQEFVQISPEEDLMGEWGKGESVAHAFEVRFPSEWYDAHTEGFPEVVKTERLVNLQKWVISTDPAKATGVTFETPIEIGGIKYYKDDEDYRIAKFRAECNKYFDVNDSIFYYIYTEMFLMIDSRVKNAFPTYFAITKEVQYKDPKTGELVYEQCKEGEIAKAEQTYYKRTGSGTTEDPYVYTKFTPQPDAEAVDEQGNLLFKPVMTCEEVLDEKGWPKGRWCWLPYDMDTANGINNEGLLVFDYSLEDTEALWGSIPVPIDDPNYPGSVPVYNGSSSVFWNNLRKAFPNEIEKKYVSLRNGAIFNYDTIEGEYEKHQYEWSAAVFNEDAYYKYINPLLTTGEDRLGMCLGSKEQQRKWWLFNRFRFIDSKYNAGDAFNNTINFRVNNLEGDKTIKITPYIDLYIKVKEGEQWQSKPVKVYRNKQTSVFIDVPTAGDTEAYIYSADQIKEVEGLNQNLHISTLDISKAVNLQHLDVSAEVSNTTLAALTVGSNKLLRKINAKNCSSLGDTSRTYYTESVDLSQCEQLEEAYFTGTLLKAVVLPEGGRLRKIELPSSITTLNLENQSKITDIKILDDEGKWDTSNIETLKVVNVNSEVQNKTVDIINTMKDGSFVKFSGFDITFTDITKFKAFIDKLFKMGGIDEPRTIATIKGTIHLDYSQVLEYSYYKAAIDRFKQLTIDCNLKREIKFYNGETYLETQSVNAPSSEGASVTFAGPAPTKPESEELMKYYDWAGWIDENGKRYDSEDHRQINEITTDLKLTAYYDELDLYIVNFYNYDGSTLLETCKTIDQRVIPGKYENPNKVFYTKEAPTAPSGYTAVWKGWTSIPYGSTDIECSEDFRTINNVKKSQNIYAQMNWEIVTIRVSKNPDKMEYYTKEYFDPKGMEITATKRAPIGDVEAVISDKEYTVETTLITPENTSVRIYSGSVETHLTVYVATGLAVTKEPYKAYQETYPARPDFTGLELTVTFTKGSETSTKVVTEGYSYEPLNFNEEEGFKNIKFTYKGLQTPDFEVLVIQSVPETLNECSWKIISHICNKGQASKYWSIGDEKVVTNSTAPSYTAGSYRYRIVGFDHNIRYSLQMNPDSGNRDLVFDMGDDHVYEYPEGKHTITFGLSKGIHDGELIEIGLSSKVLYPFVRSGNEPIYSWARGCSLRSSLDTLKGYLYGETTSDPLTPYLKEVTKGQSDQDWTYLEKPETGSNTVLAEKCRTQLDTLFIPSLYEILGKEKGDDSRTSHESTVSSRYEYYSKSDVSLIKYSADSGDAYPWWLRSLVLCGISSSNLIYGEHDIITKEGKLDRDMNPYAKLIVPFFNV